MPSRIEFRDKLPCALSGKVRKTALKEESSGHGVVDTRPGG
ncbi:hypothetical protein [Kitasatospora cineracea]|nr:hypothetical protein [Kitasatospora cineracea]